MALTCCSNGVPPPQYAWLKRNWVTDAVEPLTNAAGLFSSTLYVPITGVSDSGIYACIIFNSAGTSITETLVNLSPEGKKHPLSIHTHTPTYTHCVCVCVCETGPIGSANIVNCTL